MVFRHGLQDYLNLPTAIKLASGRVRFAALMSSLMCWRCPTSAPSTETRRNGDTAHKSSMFANTVS
jgi:hypothetical protein